MDRIFETTLADLYTRDGDEKLGGYAIDNILSLVTLCKDAKTRSYAPYSHFNVGAAGLFASATGEARMFTGANQENAAYSPTFCAECVAIMAARNGAYHELHIMAVCGAPDSSVDIDVRINADTAWVAPCGRCRQVMAETADDNCLVVLVRGDNQIMGVRFSELFPLSFGPKNLGISPSAYTV